MGKVKKPAAFNSEKKGALKDISLKYKLIAGKGKVDAKSSAEVATVTKPNNKIGAKGVQKNAGKNLKRKSEDAPEVKTEEKTTKKKSVVEKAPVVEPKKSKKKEVAPVVEPKKKRSDKSPAEAPAVKVEPKKETKKKYKNENLTVDDKKKSAIRQEKRKQRKRNKVEALKEVADKKRNQNAVSVFVGNLPVNTKRDKLFKLFSKFGKIASIRFRLSNGAKFFKSQSKITSPNVIAFVDFETMEDAKASLVLNGEKYKENVIRVNLQSSARNSESFDPKRTVVVGNLKYTATDQILHDLFSCCGDIEYTRALQSAKGCNGIGYVCFKKPESVAMALELNNSDLQGRPIRVERYSLKKTEAVKKKKEEVKASGGARRVEEKQKKEGKKDKSDAKGPKKQFAGVAVTDKKKKLKKKKTLKGPKLLAKKIASRNDATETA